MRKLRAFTKNTYQKFSAWWEHQYELPSFTLPDVRDTIVDAIASYGIATQILWVACGCPKVSSDTECHFSHFKIIGLDIAAISAVTIIHLLLRKKRYQQIKVLYEQKNNLSNAILSGQYLRALRVEETTVDLNPDNTTDNQYIMLETMPDIETKSVNGDKLIYTSNYASHNNTFHYRKNRWDFADIMLGKLLFGLMSGFISLMMSDRHDGLEQGREHITGCHQIPSLSMLGFFTVGIFGAVFTPNAVNDKAEKMPNHVHKTLNQLSIMQANQRNNSNSKDCSYGATQITRHTFRADYF